MSHNLQKKQIEKLKCAMNTNFGMGNPMVVFSFQYFQNTDPPKRHEVHRDPKFPRNGQILITSEGNGKTNIEICYSDYLWHEKINGSVQI